MTTKWKHSIRGKLTGIIMLTSTTAVLLACAGFVTSGLVNFRKRLIGDISMTAQMVASNSTAALMFGDRHTAGEVLNVLRAKPPIIAAGIYTERGETFARYEPSASIHIPRTLLPDGFYDRGDRLELFYGIRLDHERVGTLYIMVDASDRNTRLIQYAEIAAVIVLFSLLIAFALAALLQRVISGPIVELARVASLVSQHENFTLRASHPGLNDRDEIGELMTGFNRMLAALEQRDQRLVFHQKQLVTTVALRTSELTTANEELLVARDTAEKSAAISAKLARESALILNSATDGIMGIGLDNRATFLNPAAERMLRSTLNDLKGRSIHQAIHHSHADGTPWPETDCSNTRSMRNGESFSIRDDMYWRSDGTSFPVEYSSTPMLDEKGKNLGAVVTFRDMTERRAVERLKSEFVSTVSHELRTPLTSIRGALGLLGSGLLGPIASKGQRMLEIAISNTDRLVRLINDMLDLERIGSGKVELARGPVDANDVMVHALEGLQPMADEAGVRLILERASATLWGDSDRIIQTLTNLIGNAIKFSPPDTTVTVGGTSGDEDFVFCVADQGRGVPREKRETIFERFSQVDASDSRDKGGSGLGLAICQSIVTAHGGRIWAEPNDPAGSRFQFTIPLAAPSTAAQPAIDWPMRNDEPAHSLDPAANAHCILLIEDNLDLAGVMTTALQSRGIRTLHAATGRDAVRICGQHEPSLIVLDVGLPDMDGFAVVSALRESATFSRLPIIVYSALDVGSADRERLRLGPTEFLTKSRCSLTEFEGHVIRLLQVVTNRKRERTNAA